MENSTWTDSSSKVTVTEEAGDMENNTEHPTLHFEELERNRLDGGYDIGDYDYDEVSGQQSNIVSAFR